MYLGDNFYNTGVTGVDDPLWNTAFEVPYADLDVPFYPVMGNHDYGGEGVGVEFWKGFWMVDYTTNSTMPNTRYTLDLGANVALFALDTTEVFWGFGDMQQIWLQDQLDQSTATWKIAFGHHPYRSNRRHGNAGEYEGIWDVVPFSEFPRGQYVKEFIEETVCGQVDVYFAGHDHNRQWMGEHCGTEFIVSGAGAKTTNLVGRGNTGPTGGEPRCLC